MSPGLPRQLPRRPIWLLPVTAAIAGVALVAIVVAVWFVPRPPDAPPRLVFAAVERALGPMSLLTTGVDGSDLRPAYDDARSRAVGFLSPSADGRTLAFISYDPKDLQIPHLVQVIQGLGREPRTLYEIPLSDGIGGLALSPDGSRTLLTTIESHGSGATHLWSLDVASGNVTELRPGEDLHAAEFAWSPEGSRVLMIRQRQMWVMSLDGSNLAMVAGTAGVIDPRTPAWSPDGRSIAFTARPIAGARGELYTMADGGAPVQLSQTAGVQDDLTFLPRWSPDASRILFEGTIGGSQMNVFLAVVGGAVTRLNVDDNGAWDPRWTPDGSSIVFSAKLPGEGQYRLFVVPAEGGTPAAFGPAFAGPISPTEWIR